VQPSSCTAEQSGRRNSGPAETVFIALTICQIDVVRKYAHLAYEFSGRMHFGPEWGVSGWEVFMGGRSGSGRSDALGERPNMAVYGFRTDGRDRDWARAPGLRIIHTSSEVCASHKGGNPRNCRGESGQYDLPNGDCRHSGTAGPGGFGLALIPSFKGEVWGRGCRRALFAAPCPFFLRRGVAAGRQYEEIYP
jgi:hypothetical protein